MIPIPAVAAIVVVLYVLSSIKILRVASQTTELALAATTRTQTESFQTSKVPRSQGLHIRHA